jgi:hypothetical protein
MEWRSGITKDGRNIRSSAKANETQQTSRRAKTYSAITKRVQRGCRQVPRQYRSLGRTSITAEPSVHEWEDARSWIRLGCASKSWAFLVRCGIGVGGSGVESMTTHGRGESGWPWVQRAAIKTGRMKMRYRNSRKRTNAYLIDSRTFLHCLASRPRRVYCGLK